MHRFAKLAAGLAVAGIALLIALTLVVRSQIEPEKLKARIEAEAGKALGRTVKVGSVSASWGAAVSIGELAIMDAEGKAPQVTLASARVAIALSALAKGEVRLDSVSLDGLTIHARRLADGTLDSADVLAKVGGGAAGAGQAGAGAPVVVSFSDAKITVQDDAGALPGRLTWSGISGSINSGEEIALALTGALAVGDSPVASKLIVKADYRLAAGEGKVTLTGRGLKLEKLSALVPALRAAPSAQGEAEITATFALAKTTPSLTSLAVALKGARLAGAPLSAPIEGLTGEVAYTGSAIELSGLALATMGARLGVPKAVIAVKPGGLQADKLDFVLNDLPVSCSLSVSGWPAAPQVALRVSATDADLAKLSKMASGNVTLDVTLAGPPGQLAATGQARISTSAPVKVQLPAAAGGAALTIASGTFALNGRDLATTDLACQAFGVTCRPRLSVLSLTAAPQIALDTGAMQIDLSKLAGSLPADAAKLIASLAPQGQMKVALRASGALGSPRLSGAIEPEGVSLELPGTGRRVTLARGRIDIAGTRATVEGVTLVHEGLSVSVSGGVENLVGTPRVSLQVTGSGIDVAQVAALLPADAKAQLDFYHVSGAKLNVMALVAGSPGALRADARIGIQGLSAVAPVQDRRVELKNVSGTVEVTPDALRFGDVKGLALDQNVPFELAGCVTDYLTEPALDVTAVAKGLTVQGLRGLAPDSVLAEMNKRRAQLAFDAKAQVRGTKKQPAVKLSVLPTSGSLPLPVAGRNLVATLAPGGEVSMDDGTVVLAGLPVTVASNTATISGRIEDPQGAGKLDLKIQGQGLNLAGLAPMMPEAARRALAQSGFKGGKGLVASVKGTFAAPQIDAQVDLAGAEFASLPGLGAGRIPSGSLKLAGSAVLLEKLTFEVGGVPVDVGGKVTLGGEPSLALTVRGDRVDLVSLSASMPLPAGTSLDGTTKLDVKIEGSPSAPRVTGRLGLTGVGIRTTALATPLRGESGELVLAGEDIVIQDAAFRAGASRVTARGKILRFASDAVCEGVEVSGPVELSDLAARLGVALTGKGTVTARASGPARDATMEGTLSVASATYTSAKGAAIPLRDFSADFSRGPTQIKVTRLEGLVAGGKLSATGVVNNPASAPGAVFQMTLAGAALAQLVPQGETGLAGKLDVSFNGSGASAGTLSGNGQMKVNGLVVDLSRNGQLKGLARKVSTGRVVGLLAGALSKSRNRYLDEGNAQAAFYDSVLAEVRQSNQLGTVSAPIAASAGVVRMEPIAGENLSGRVSIGLASGAVSGRIDRLALGKAGLSIELGGTLAAPAPNLDREAITYEGKTYAQLKAEQDKQQASADGQAASGDAAAPAGGATPAPTRKKKLGDLLLDTLKGAGESGEEAPAPGADAPATDAPAEAPAPEPAPSPQKKKRNKLLNILLDNVK